MERQLLAVHPKRPFKFSKWKTGEEHGRRYDTYWFRKWTVGGKITAAVVYREGKRGPFTWAMWAPDQFPGTTAYMQGEKTDLEEAKSRADHYLKKVGIEE